MADPNALGSQRQAIADLLTWLAAERVSGILIGGVAASLLGRPRLTRDVDALVLLDAAALATFLSNGKRFGFAPRRPNAVGFAAKHSVLLVRHEPSSTPVDLTLGSLEFEKDAVAHAQTRNLGGVAIPLPRPEDLIVMKAVAHRPQDLADIAAVAAANPKLDRRRIRRLLQEFAEALEMPDLPVEVVELLAQRRRPREGRDG